MKLVQVYAFDLGKAGGGVVPVPERDTVFLPATADCHEPKPFIVLRQRSSIGRMVLHKIGEVKRKSVPAMPLLFAEIAEARNIAMGKYVNDNDDDALDDAPSDEPASAVASAVVLAGSNDGDGADSDAPVSANASAASSDSEGSAASVDGGDAQIAPVATKKGTRGEKRAAARILRLRRLTREMSMPATVSVCIARECESDWEFDVITKSSCKASPAIELSQRNIDKLCSTLALDNGASVGNANAKCTTPRKTKAADGYGYCYRSKRWFKNALGEDGSGKRKRTYLSETESPPPNDADITQKMDPLQ
jgi:hypothetical protein